MPTSSGRDLLHTPQAPLIAIVGSDGSGKSTVGAALLAWLQLRGPAELCHLGKQSGNMHRAIGRLPLFGRRMERSIEKKVKSAGTARGPGTLAALLIYAFTLRRVRRFRRMLALRKKGVAILADRFPQLALPTAIDGPGFARLPTEHGLARRLAASEQRHFAWMTGHRPDLVLRLNVDLATAAARKPDHDPASLDAKIATISRLSFAGAPIVDIDARRPVGEVIVQAKAAIETMLAETARHG